MQKKRGMKSQAKRGKSKSCTALTLLENAGNEYERGQALPLVLYEPRFSLSVPLTTRPPRFLSPSPVFGNVGFGDHKSTPSICLSRSPKTSLTRSLFNTQFSLLKSEGYPGQHMAFNFKEEGEENSLRRSPRLSTPVFGSKKLQMVSFPMSESSKNVSSLSVLSNTSNCQRRASTESEAKPLLISWHEDDGKKPMAVDCQDSEVSHEKHLRRSPRFTLATEIDVRKKSLGQCISLSSDEKQTRRSPRLSTPLSGAENSNTNCNSGGFSHLMDKRPSKRVRSSSKNSDLGMSDGKLVRRSPRMANSDLGAVADTAQKTCNLIQLPESNKKHSSKKKSSKKDSPEQGMLLSSKKQQEKYEPISSLIGHPVSDDEAHERWGWRYEMKNQRSKSGRHTLDNDDNEDKIVWNVECHYSEAQIDGCTFNLGDCAYIKGEGEQKHVGRIIEFFKTTDGKDYFRVQWFYKAEDTVMKEEAAFHDKKRLFYSTVMNDNPLDCIISKVSVVQLQPKMSLKSRSVPPSDFYYDMEYCLDYSTFRTLLTNNSIERHDSSPDPIEAVSATTSNSSVENVSSVESYKAELALLDLFSGCGGMSTGLCLGAKISCVDLVTRWALDMDKSACESFKLNHPETHVRNEAAEDFLELLKEWEKLCKQYAVNQLERTHLSRSMALKEARRDKVTIDVDIPPNEFEVSRIVDICYGDPDKTGKRGLKFKVHWKGYGTSEDTWEPIEGLRNCRDSIKDFVRNGFKSKILPLPGDVDVICGGPPCQGISGYNRFRNVDSPLDDERNRQIVVFMDIVQFLKPRYVLMENVVDILRFGNGSLGRYALSRLVHMKYQARLGTIAAGCYGLPQFRLRIFLWGAHHCEKLPQFPLPTHDVIIKYGPPSEFERNTVGYDEGQPRELEKAVVLQDAISDLPAVTSQESREEMAYEKPPETEFQSFIRSTKYEMTGSASSGAKRTNNLLYDHRPYSLSEEDYIRVCQIPKRKGANFRDLPGVVVGADNIVRRDSTKKQIVLPSGKPLVPDFALNYEQGKSKRPYARLWWDEVVSTVVTFPDLHCQIVVHPEQDRVLTLRECARLQGFPDYYRFCGTIKQRYRQVGNAVAVPVGRSLGYALGMAFQKLTGDEHLMTLPTKFSHSTNLQLAKSMFQKAE